MVQFVVASDAETHQSHLKRKINNASVLIASGIQGVTGSYSDNVADFETFISFDKDFETLRQAAMFTNVVLQSSDTVITDDEPEFKGAEATAQRDAPML